MSKDIVRYGDDAMYDAQPIKRQEGTNRRGPQVYLLSATADPLGALAAGMRMYRGDPPYSLGEVTDDERRWAWDESIKTHLKAPWEFIDFQFLLEGVTRAFTHQLVRQRTAVYAQESLRFAVKRGFADEAAVPVGIQGDEQAEALYRHALDIAQGYYEMLIDSGVPAEDARALLPHGVTTRVIYKTNFRGLMEHAGNRLCTQAQFEWRAVFMGIMKAIREYRSYHDSADGGYGLDADWQWEIIAKPMAQTFAPVCYKAGHCVFMSELDRGCTIRERVNEGRFDEIDPMEWMANPMAGITDESNPRPEREA